VRANLTRGVAVGVAQEHLEQRRVVFVMSGRRDVEQRAKVPDGVQLSTQVLVASCRVKGLVVAAVAQGRHIQAHRKQQQTRRHLFLREAHEPSKALRLLDHAL
jgi:hypothetical protein